MNVRNPKTGMWFYASIIFFSVASDSISGIIIYPFIPSLIVDRFGIPRKYVGFYSGLLFGAFEGAQFLSSFYLGHLSDWFGRKKILVASLLVSGITIFSFAYVRSFYVALFLKTFNGLVNMAGGIADVIFADLTEPKSLRLYRSHLFAVLGTTYAISRSLGSAFTVFAFKHTIVPFDPYTMSCMTGTAFVSLSLLLVIFFFKETNNWKHVNRKDPEVDGDGPSLIQSLVNGVQRIRRSKILTQYFLIYALNDFANGSIFIVIILFAYLPQSLGGLGFGPRESSFILIIYGFNSLVLQIFVYKRLTRKLGYYRTYLFGTLSSVTFSILFPLVRVFDMTSDFQNPVNVVKWILVLLPLSAGLLTMLPTISNMISLNTNNRKQGIVLGTANSLNSLTRFISSLAFSALFSLVSNEQFWTAFLGGKNSKLSPVFWTLGLVYFGCFLLAIRMRRQSSKFWRAVRVE